MNKIPRPQITLALLLVLLVGSIEPRVLAGDVTVSISSRETYVNMPIQLQIRIDNTETYDAPELPDIDGVEIRSAGSPAKSYQSIMLNGRWSERTSETLLYTLTPLREGTFEIPPLTLTVDGKKITIDGTQFVATKSETGDLLFVETVAAKEKVYVGEPLELTLRIDIKPFRDRDAEITLSEADMWRLVSNQSTWGSFTDRMRKLQENSQRPGGREILRDDGQGKQRSYFRYEIDAQIYPTREGQIDASDIRIVVNYPTKLGRPRSAFGSLLGDDPFDSPLSQMLDDSFFSSPLSNRLAITEMRPVVAEARSAATLVVPVPELGRPADYRGAVGQYRIVTEASPTKVQAGDPIKLNIGIVGTGPMELVQAPPLGELSALSEFKVANEPLAGFVRDDAKVFSTSIRPRTAGIADIPAIAFSYFDPETEQFKTAYSQPIAITVTESESLGLDAIMGAKAPATGDQANASAPPADAAKSVTANLENAQSKAILLSQAVRRNGVWAWLLIILPPLAWLLIAVTWHRTRLVALLPSFRSPQQRFEMAIVRSQSADEVLLAFIHRINSLLHQKQSTQADLISTVGTMRAHGAYAIAAEVESLAARVEALHRDGEEAHESGDPHALNMFKQSALDLASRAQSHFQGRGNSRLAQRSLLPASRSGAKSRTTALLLLVAVGINPAATALANEDMAATLSEGKIDKLLLTPQQQATILDEATAIYLRASGWTESDASESQELFEQAAEKYQLLVDSGIQNSQLYCNLGNSYLQSRQVGRAIANYQRALHIAPGNRQARTNLEFAEQWVEARRETGMPAVEQPSAGSADSSSTWLATALQMHQQWVAFIGGNVRILILGCASFAFWGLLIARTIGFVFPLGRVAVGPLLLLLLSTASLAISATEPRDTLAVIVSNEVTMRAGDGEQFAEVAKLTSADGWRVRVVALRDNWLQVIVNTYPPAWIAARDVELLP